jgi:class 3 adenylate cyclase
LPEAIDGVIARAMAKDADERFPTAMDFASSAAAAVAADKPGPYTSRGFLFADLRDYTAFVEQRGDDDAAALLARFRTVVRGVIAANDGTEIRTEGDSIYVVYPSASSAVISGIAIARECGAATAAEPSLPLHVGIGVHTGEATDAPEGFVGSAVNVAARLAAIARPGEVLVTDVVRGVVRTRPGLRFEERGRERLKGINEPMMLYRATAKISGDEAVPASPGTRRGIAQVPPVVLGLAAVALLLVAGGLVALFLPPASTPSPIPSSPGGGPNGGVASHGPTSVAPTLASPSAPTQTAGATPTQAPVRAVIVDPPSIQILDNRAVLTEPDRAPLAVSKQTVGPTDGWTFALQNSPDGSTWDPLPGNTDDLALEVARLGFSGDYHLRWAPSDPFGQAGPPSPVLGVKVFGYQEDNPDMVYVGDWTQQSATTGFATTLETTEAGATVSFTIQNAHTVAWIAPVELQPAGGEVEISVNNEVVGTFTLDAPVAQSATVIYSTPWQPVPTALTMRIRVIDPGNGVGHDAFLAIHGLSP